MGARTLDVVAITVVVDGSMFKQLHPLDRVCWMVVSVQTSCLFKTSTPSVSGSLAGSVSAGARSPRAALTGMTLVATEVDAGTSTVYFRTGVRRTEVVAIVLCMSLVGSNH